MKRLLIIEDDPAIQRGLKIAFEQERYAVETASDGEFGFELAKSKDFDAIILDLMLPSKSGEHICRDLRLAGITTPILMLTSKSDELDKVVGFKVGADDYVTKPFSIHELKARIEAILRRVDSAKSSLGEKLPKTAPEEFAFSDVVICFRKQEVKKAGKELKLSVKEFEILKFLIEHEGEVVSRETLLREVWGYRTAVPTTRTVDNYILSLRKKLECDAAHPKHLLTVHTSGYKFVR